MHVCMDGWMDGWMDGCTEYVCMHEWMNELSRKDPGVFLFWGGGGR